MVFIFTFNVATIYQDLVDFEDKYMVRPRIARKHQEEESQ